MISIQLTIPARKPAKRRGLSFEGTITLGNLLAILPLLGLVGIALTTYWTVATEVQRFRDSQSAQTTAIEHERQLRETLLTVFGDKLTELRAQEARDVTVLTQAITELRQDIRAASRGRAPD